MAKHILDQNSKPILTVNGNLLLIVAYNGKGKSEFLNRIYSSEYTLEEFEGTIYHLSLQGIKPDIKEYIDSEESYKDFINNNISSTLRSVFLKRLPYSLLFDNTRQDLISYQRLVYLKIISSLKGRKLILIDEPELLAHPSIRKEINIALKDLVTANNPVIATTNLDNTVSDLVSYPSQIAKIKNLDEERYIQADMSKIQKEVRKFYHNDTYLLRRFSASSQKDQGLNNIIEKNYSSYLGSSLTEYLFDIMFADAVVLGEGASEKVLFRYVDNVLHPQWIRDYKVTFVNCLGKSTLPLYFIFMNAIGLKTICMYDLDKLNNPVHNSYNNAFQQYQKDNPDLFRCMIMQPDLEDKLHIKPNYKLESIEKPVNIYAHSFVSSSIKNEVNSIANQWEKLIKEMD